MKNELELVRAFHEKFKAPVAPAPTLIPDERSLLRLRLMRDEVEEYAEGVLNRDLENIAKELADILYATYGTILEHGLQDKMEAIFEEVHYSNMSKEYHQFKMVKGAAWFPAKIGKILSNDAESL